MTRAKLMEIGFPSNRFPKRFDQMLGLAWGMSGAVIHLSLPCLWDVNSLKWEIITVIMEITSEMKYFIQIK